MINSFAYVVTTGSVAYAAPSPSPSPAKVNPDQVSAGLLGFIVFAFLAGAGFLLWRSMTKQMRKVPESFDVVDDRADDPDRRKDSPGDQGSSGDGTAAIDTDDPQEPPSR